MGALWSAVRTKVGKGPAQEQEPGFGASLSVPWRRCPASLGPKALYSHPQWAEERTAYSNTGNRNGGLQRSLEAVPHHTPSSERPSTTHDLPGLRHRSRALQSPVGLWNQKKESLAPSPTSATYLSYYLKSPTFLSLGFLIVKYLPNRVVLRTTYNVKSPALCLDSRKLHKQCRRNSDPVYLFHAHPVASSQFPCGWQRLPDLGHVQHQGPPHQHVVLGPAHHHHLQGTRNTGKCGEKDYFEKTMKLPWLVVLSG